MHKLKCSKSDKPCELCELNSECSIYSERLILEKQLKRLLKVVQDTELILKAILQK